MLIDIAISGDRNVIKKAEKILKYKDLIIEMQRMCSMQAKDKMQKIIKKKLLSVSKYSLRTRKRNRHGSSNFINIL